jgi:hypothetical protein
VRIVAEVARRGKHARTEPDPNLSGPQRDVRQTNTAWDHEAWNARIAARVALDYAEATEARAL